MDDEINENSQDSRCADGSVYIERGRYIGTLRAGVLNLINRNNLFYYDLFTFSRVDQLPLIPSVGFKMELR